MSTYFPKPGEIVRKWYVVDANGQTLGRLAPQWRASSWVKKIRNTRPFLTLAIT